MLVPFTSINFSNVKAQEYGTFDEYDDDMYSTYPTESNKYECRTGPFEGFFVSSVEFCKHVKFDNDKDRKDIRDNRTGDKGPTGDRGQPGTAGIFQLNSTNIYRVGGIPGTNDAPAFSSCDAGDVVLIGGFKVISRGDSPISIILEGPPINFPNPPQAYSVFLESENTSDDLVYESFAFCFDNPPLTQ
jgi:hypothetical protein